jgi:hypothetical protein
LKRETPDGHRLLREFASLPRERRHQAACRFDKFNGFGWEPGSDLPGYVARLVAQRGHIVVKAFYTPLQGVPAHLSPLEPEHTEADGHEGRILKNRGSSGEIDISHGTSVPPALAKGPATLGISDGG